MLPVDLYTKTRKTKKKKKKAREAISEWNGPEQSNKTNTWKW
jgi:hypothetical protein